MKNTTLCYIERDGKYLMLHRTKKENDLNHDKWIGIGGKLEENESPEDCLKREVYEETGLTLTSYRYCGIITFVSDRWEGEYMHLFSADGFEGILRECDEGVLEWVDKNFVHALPQWEGDKLFLRELERNVPFFSMKLVYEGETLVFASENGKRIK
ncbi:MAG: 8-oxo-dGTP diphosphatase [Clostridia bacterium]|nr:8-oxo-dGTP diphosphatase [Clostridia bacterium]